MQLPVIPVASEGDTLGSNFITAVEKELEAKLLPSSGGGESDSDEELMGDDSDVELLDGPEGGGVEGDMGIDQEKSAFFLCWETTPVGSSLVAWTL